jgi:hypothetical protein
MPRLDKKCKNRIRCLPFCVFLENGYYDESKRKEERPL